MHDKSSSIDYNISSIANYAKAARLSNGGEDAIALIIEQALQNPTILAYAELLNERKVLESKCESHVRLLEIFTHGTVLDYKRALEEVQTKKISSLPELTVVEENKLKQLTVVTLAQKMRVLPYEILREQLEIECVRELEDFLINEVIATGIVKGQLNQSVFSFEVHSAIGRDLKPGQMAEVLNTMREWKESCDEALRTIENQILDIKTEQEMERLRKLKLQMKQQVAEKNAILIVAKSIKEKKEKKEEKEGDVAMEDLSGGGTKRKGEDRRR